MISDLPGQYSCIVHDSLGRNSQERILEVKGIEISGFPSTVSAGDQVTATCSYDLNSTSIEWLYNGQIILTTEDSQLNLTFNPVNDTINNREYLCRVNTAYGTQERSITVQVQAPSTVITTSITPIGPAVAGYNFSMTCSVTLSNGFSDVPTISWTNPEGQALFSSGDVVLQNTVTVGQVSYSTILFDPIRTSAGGTYICSATFESLALTLRVNSSTSYIVQVQQNFQIPVTIMDSQGNQGSTYLAGTNVTLTCSADPRFGPFTTTWTSTCSGNCFVLQQSSQNSVTQAVLHGVDGGNHTCTLTDDVGNVGSATLDMRISGVQLYVFDDRNPGLLPNNSIVLADNFGRFPKIQCISGSILSNAGQWFSPSGEDITMVSTDVFDVSLGSLDDPGILNVSLASGLYFTLPDQGLYGCHIPDEMGKNSSVFVGIYSQSFASPVRITSLEQISNAKFRLNCTTSLSPATTVIWSKDGEVLVSNETYQTSQYIRNGQQTIYDNTLSIDLPADDILGNYSCSVRNMISSTTESFILVEGVTFSGATNLTVGENSTILCNADIPVQRIEWLFGATVVASSSGSQSLELTFSPVEEFLHNRQYVCRAITAFGTVERSVTLLVTIPPDAISLSILPVGRAVAGNMYQLICTATILEGVRSIPVFTWFGTDGNVLMSNGDITLGTPSTTSLPLLFSLLRISDSGTYTCNATFYSLALQQPLLLSSSATINIQYNPIAVELRSTPVATEINAAESFTLSCVASGGTGVYSYLWTSTCTGGCVLTSANQASSILVRDAARASDSGTYSCSVTDNAENTGANNTVVQVTGVGMYDSGTGRVANNSILEADSDGHIPQLLCLSASNMSTVGDWIAPSGANLDAVLNDPFDVTFGGSNNPGMLLISTPTTNPRLTAAHEGVYTCSIPDEYGEEQNILVGIYLSARVPSVSSLSVYDSNTSEFTLNCESTDSPATTLILSKDGDVFTNYSIQRILTNGVTSTYNNLISIDSTPDDIVGLYTCSVLNTAGQSNIRTINIEGLRIIGAESPLSLGDSAMLNCTSDLPIVMAEWYSNGDLIVHSSQESAILDISAVNDSLHGRQYNCRVITPYGIQQRNLTLTVSIPLSSLRLTTSLSRAPSAGSPFRISCVLTRPAGLLTLPEIYWTSSDGSRINGQLNTTETMTTSTDIVTVDFDPLLASQNGIYTCQATVSSPAFSQSQVLTSEVTANIQLPSPTVALEIVGGGTTLIAGSSLMLRCNVLVDGTVDIPYQLAFVWSKSGANLASTSRSMISNGTQLSQNAYYSVLEIASLSRIADSGTYSCRVNLQPESTNLQVQGSSQTNMEAISVQDPSLVVLIGPITQTVLDVAPYNRIQITCNASSPQVTSTTKTVTWTYESPSGVRQTLFHNGQNTNITSYTLNEPSSASSLSAFSSSVGVLSYTCRFSLQIPGDPPVQYMQTAQVTVKGPSAPQQPVNVIHSTLSSTEAVIRWVVPELSYTPENYIVSYGKNQNLLNYTSDPVPGSTDITSLNQIYSINLIDLQPNQTYYYQVTASNTIGSNSSDIQSLITPLPILKSYVNSTGSLTAGGILSLTCTVTRIHNISGDILIRWVGPDGVTISGSSSVQLGSLQVSGNVRSLSIQFSPLYTSHGGIYTCESTFDSDSIMYTISTLQDVVVTVPAPETTITAAPTGPLYTGMELILTCTHTLNDNINSLVTLNSVWRRGGQLLTSSARVNTSATILIRPSVYETTLTIHPLSNSLDNGQYSCHATISSEDYVIYEQGLQQILITAQDLPDPVILVLGSERLIAGDNGTIVCYVSVIDGLVDDASVEVSWTDNNGNQLDADSSQTVGRNRSSTIELNPILLSSGGRYTCSASVRIPSITVVRRNSEPYDAIIQIPTPALDLDILQSEPLLSGMFAQIRCSITTDDSIDMPIDVTVQWERNGEEINATSRVMPLPIRMVGTSTYESILQLNTLSRTVDTGQYVCSSRLESSANTNYSISSLLTNSYQLFITDPEVMVTVAPSAISGKDIEPFNTVSLTCTATKPALVVPQVQISWSQNGMPLDSSIMGVSISEENINSSVTISTVQLNAARVVDSGTYTCDVSINIPDSDSVSTNDSASIIISGAIAPNTPAFQETRPTSTEAAITWIVQTISYTPETYYIQYGVDMSSLMMTSERLNGSLNLTSSNIAYSITLTNLQPYTQYYFRISAENSFATSQTSTYTFRTSESDPSAPPESFTVVQISASNVTLSWTAPEESGRNGLITGYTVSCNDEASSSSFSAMTAATELSTTLVGLMPYITYSCSVTASNTAGASPAATLNFTTLADAPDDTPINLQVTGTSSSTVLVAWIEPATPNGVISGYILYVNYTDGSPISTVASNSASTNYTITGLLPYQLVQVSVSAVTVAGEGPMSEIASGRSAEEDVAEPLVTTFESGSAIAGQPFTLFCRVVVSEDLVNPPSIVWLSPQGDRLATSEEVTVGLQQLTGNPSRLNTYMAQFNPLMTSNSGVYMCRATVVSPYRTKQATISRSHNITVQIPSPNLSLMQSLQPVYAGSFLILNCSIEASNAVNTEVYVTAIWRRNNMLLTNQSHRTVGTVNSAGMSLYFSQTTFNPVQLGLDDGTYACEVTINSMDEFVLSTTAVSNTITISATAPTLIARIEPETTSILDVPPLNVFNLQCTANAQEGVILLKTFQWQEEATTISDNGNSVLISVINSTMPRSISDLTVSGPPVGSRRYACLVMMSVPNGEILSARASGLVVVKGPGRPILPTGIDTINITAYSATIVWQVPSLAYSQERYNVSYGRTRSSLTSSLIITGTTVNRASSNMTYDTIISNLIPNTMYYYQLRSMNSQGMVTSNVMEFVTSEAGPSSPPIDFSITAIAFDTIALSWNPPPLNQQNGIITNYFLSCLPLEVTGNNFTMSYSTFGTYTMNGFSPAKTYNCSIYAVTSGGRGPAAYESVTLLDGVPGQIENLMFIKISPSVLQVMWSIPRITNGVVRSYLVQVERYDGLIFSNSFDGQQTSALVPNLAKYIPYNVSVSARTSAGYGPAVSNITFTEEGAPSIAPRQININRINVTHMNVSWAKMSLREANGFITGYNIRYDSIDTRSRRAAVLVVVDSDSFYKVVGGLGYTQSYLITVSASTAAGEGASSRPVLVEAPAYSYFQLRLTGISNCLEWRSRDVLNKLDSAALEMTAKLTSDCRCTLASDYFTEGSFSCDSKEPSHAIYRAKLSSTSATSSSKFIEILQGWVTSGSASLTLDSLQLYLDPTCEVEISSFNDPLCSYEGPTTKSPEKETADVNSSTDSGNMTVVIIAVIVGVFALLFVLVIITVCALFIFQRMYPGKKSNHYGFERNLHEGPIREARYNELPERRHHGVLPKPKEVEAELSLASLPAEAASNDYEALDAVLAVTKSNAQADIDDKVGLEVEGEAKVDLTTL